MCPLHEYASLSVRCTPLENHSEVKRQGEIWRLKLGLIKGYTDCIWSWLVINSALLNTTMNRHRWDPLHSLPLSLGLIYPPIEMTRITACFHKRHLRDVLKSSQSPPFLSEPIISLRANKWGNQRKCEPWSADNGVGALLTQGVRHPGRPWTLHQESTDTQTQVAISQEGKVW